MFCCSDRRPFAPVRSLGVGINFSLSESSLSYSGIFFSYSVFFLSFSLTCLFERFFR